MERLEPEKSCAKCRRMMPVDFFARNRRTKDGRQAYCKQCHAPMLVEDETQKTLRRERAKKYAQKPGAKERRAAHRKKQYWKNPERARATVTNGIRKKQTALAGRPPPSACECCGIHMEGREISWDHCHATGLFRGWICTRCNVALGMIRDSIPQLYALIGYLRKNSS